MFSLLSWVETQGIPPSPPPSALFVCFTLVFRSLSVLSCPSSLNHAPGLQKRGFPGRPVRYEDGRLARVERLSAGSRRFPGMYFFPSSVVQQQWEWFPSCCVPSSLPVLLWHSGPGSRTSSSIRKTIAETHCIGHCKSHNFVLVSQLVGGIVSLVSQRKLEFSTHNFKVVFKTARVLILMSGLALGLSLTLSKILVVCLPPEPPESLFLYSIRQQFRVFAAAAVQMKYKNEKCMFWLGLILQRWQPCAHHTSKIKKFLSYKAKINHQ